jgi:hypothetical protein
LNDYAAGDIAAMELSVPRSVHRPVILLNNARQLCAELVSAFILSIGLRIAFQRSVL